MQDLHGEAARAFHEVAAEMEDLVFGVAEEDELFEAYGLSADTVCLFKKVSGLGAVGLLWGPVLTVPCLQFDEGRTDFPVDPEQGLDVAKLTQQLVVHSLKLVMDYSNEVWLLPTPAPAWLQGAWPHPPPAPQTSSQIFGAKIPYHMLLFLNTSVAEQQALRDEFRVAASTFRGEVRWSHGKKGWELGDHSFSAACPPLQVLFVVVDVNGYGAAVLSFFGLTPSDAPTLRCIKMENNRKYRMEVDAFSATAVRDFVQEVLDGKVKVRRWVPGSEPGHVSHHCSVWAPSAGTGR